MASEVEIRAEHARQVLDNPVFKEAFYGLQVGIMDDIAGTAIEDADKRNQLGLKLQVTREFEQALLDAIQDLQISERPEEFEHPTLM